MAEVQKAVDEDLNFQNISETYEIQLRDDLAAYRTTLKSGTRLTRKGAAKDVLDTALFVHREVSHALTIPSILTNVYLSVQIVR